MDIGDQTRREFLVNFGGGVAAVLGIPKVVKAIDALSSPELPDIPIEPMPRENLEEALEVLNSFYEKGYVYTLGVLGIDYPSVPNGEILNDRKSTVDLGGPIKSRDLQFRWETRDENGARKDITVYMSDSKLDGYHPDDQTLDDVTVSIRGTRPATDQERIMTGRDTVDFYKRYYFQDPELLSRRVAAGHGRLDAIREIASSPDFGPVAQLPSRTHRDLLELFTKVWNAHPNIEYNTQGYPRKVEELADGTLRITRDEEYNGPAAREMKKGNSYVRLTR